MNINKYNPISEKFDYYNYEVVYNNLGTVIENTIGDPSTITPNTGNRYIPLNPSIGVWLGQYPNIATWDGTQWVYYTPILNDRVTVTTGVNAGKVYFFDGTDWVEQTTTSNDWAVGGNILSSPGYFGSLNSNPVVVGTVNTEAYRIDTSQRILVGTNTSLNNFRKLQVRGTQIINDRGLVKVEGGSSAFSILTESSITNTNRFGLVVDLQIIPDTLTSTASSNLSGIVSTVNYPSGTYNIGGLGLFSTSINNLTISNTGTVGLDSVGFGNVSTTRNILTLTNAPSFVNLNETSTTGASSGVFQIRLQNFTGNSRFLSSVHGMFYPTGTNNPGFIDDYSIFRAAMGNGTGSFNVGNLYGFKVESNFDRFQGVFTAPVRYPFFSDSAATSQHRGDFEFLGAVKLRGISNFVNVRANSATSPYTLTLPTDIGTNGYILQTDGVSQASWVDPNINDIPEWIAPPLTSTSTGLQGQKAIDANYIYFCYTDNQWARTSRDLTIW